MRALGALEVLLHGNQLTADWAGEGEERERWLPGPRVGLEAWKQAAGEAWQQGALGTEVHDDRAVLCHYSS